MSKTKSSIRYSAQYLWRVAKVAAKADPSDPFVFNRVLTHMKNGIVNPAETLADAAQRLGLSAEYALARYG